MTRTARSALLEELRRRGIRPIAGGSPEGDPPPADPPPADPPPANPPADPPNDDDKPSGLTNAEVRALRETADKAQKAAAKSDRERRDRERAAAEAAGNFEELHKQSSAQVEKVTGLVRTHAVSSAVAAAAERLGYRTPSIAAKLVDTADLTVEVDLEAATLPELDAAGKAKVEERLKELAGREPGLLREGPGRMLPGAGGQGAAGNGDGGSAAMNAAIRTAAGR